MTTSRGVDGVSARRWTIFISHSAKDNGKPTPVAGTIMAALRTALEGKFELLIDENMPKGSVWNPLLHQWIAKCDAAIVLLDEKALDSDWVKREFSIFMLRHALCPGFVVLPVIINLEREEIKKSFFADLLPMQDVDVPTAAHDQVAPEERDRAIADIIKFTEHNFSGPPGGLSDVMFKWLVQVAVQLPTDPDLLGIAAESFGCEENGLSLARIGNGPWFMADQFLSVTGDHLELWRITSAVQELRGGMNTEQCSELGNLLSPVWVGPERARQLLPQPGQDKKKRLVLLPADEPKTAENYISRAYCCSNSLRMVQASGVPTGEGEEEILADVEYAVKSLNLSPYPRPELLYYLIIPTGIATRQKESILWVHGYCPDITVMALTGTNDISTSRRIEGAFSGVVTQLDGVDSETEDKVRQWVNDLRHGALKLDYDMIGKRR